MTNVEMDSMDLIVAEDNARAETLVARTLAKWQEFVHLAEMADDVGILDDVELDLSHSAWAGQILGRVIMCNVSLDRMSADDKHRAVDTAVMIGPDYAEALVTFAHTVRKLA